VICLRLEEYKSLPSAQQSHPSIPLRLLRPDPWLVICVVRTPTISGNVSIFIYFRNDDFGIGDSQHREANCTGNGGTLRSAGSS
jgi:hypothetical protein